MFCPWVQQDGLLCSYLDTVYQRYPSRVLAKQEQQSSTRAASRMPKFRRQQTSCQVVTKVHVAIEGSTIERSSTLAREGCATCLRLKPAIFSASSSGHEAQTWPANFTKSIPSNAWTQGSGWLSENKLSLAPTMYQGMINAHAKHVI